MKCSQKNIIISLTTEGFDGVGLALVAASREGGGIMLGDGVGTTKPCVG